MSCRKLHAWFTTRLPRNTTWPRDGDLQHCLYQPYLRTFLSTTQWCSNFFTCCSFPFRNRPGLSNRCISASFGCRMRRIGFFTHFQDLLCPLPSKLHAWSSCCTAPCLHRTTVATQAIGALHIIPFLRIAPACPLFWSSRTSVQVRSR